MKKPNLPYLEFKTVKGRPYVYFRRGSERARLPGNPHSEEFMREYWSIRSGKKKTSSKTTWESLIVH